jgi:hypothetical protein
MITRLTLIIIGIVLSISCRNTVNKTLSNDYIESTTFEKRFPLKNLKSFNSNKIGDRIINSENLVSNALMKKIFPDSMIDFINDSNYYCSIQKGNKNYSAYTFFSQSTSADGSDFIYWINLNNTLKPVGVIAVAGAGGEAGGGKMSSRLINDSTLIITTISVDQSDELNDSNNDKEYYTELNDSTVDKVIIESSGRFKNVFHQNFHKEQQIKNEDYIHKPGSTDKKE